MGTIVEDVCREIRERCSALVEGMMARKMRQIKADCERWERGEFTTAERAMMSLFEASDGWAARVGERCSALVEGMMARKMRQIKADCERWERGEFTTAERAMMSLFEASDGWAARVGEWWLKAGESVYGDQPGPLERVIGSMAWANGICAERMLLLARRGAEKLVDGEDGKEMVESLEESRRMLATIVAELEVEPAVSPFARRVRGAWTLVAGTAVS